MRSEGFFVHKSGPWYSYQEDRIGQGRENAKKYLKDHPDVAAAIEQQLRQILGLIRVAAESPPGAEPHGGPVDLETHDA